jgi:hypothetical protein
MDNKDTKSIVGGVESEGAFSSDISSEEGYTSAVVHAPGKNEKFKADTHNLNRSSFKEGFPTNFGSSSSEEDVACSVAALKYTSHSTGTVPVMDKKDTKNIVGGVESEGGVSSHISSVKGHTSTVVRVPGQNEELKADPYNLSSSLEDGSNPNFGSSSSKLEEVASLVVASLYCSSVPESLWSEVRPRNPSRVKTRK